MAEEDDSLSCQKLLSLTHSTSSPVDLAPNDHTQSKGQSKSPVPERVGENHNEQRLLSSLFVQDNPAQFTDRDQCYSWLQNFQSSSDSSSESSTSSSSSNSSLPLPPAPDGGWGWFVVLGAFMVSVICDGLAFCFGVLYSELLVQFNESRSKTSMVGSIFFGVSMLCGPLASSLTSRFGCQKMTIFGGFLSCFGFLLSCFATSIEMLCFTFSVVVGMGFSFCYITSVVIVAFYFDKKRAMATGLAVCGTGVGTFSFAPLMDYLITEYGWRGLFLIMAGISLNLVVCGMLFRPLHFTEVQRWDMLLQEFNRIPFSREDIEVVRSRFPSESSSDSNSESDENIYDEDSRALSLLSLPTFVSKKKMEIPSPVLLEALRNSKNPHLTMHRYMKNAMMRADHVNQEIPAVQHDPNLLTVAVTYTITPSPSLSLASDGSKKEDTVNSMPSSILDDCNPHKEGHATSAEEIRIDLDGNKLIEGKRGEDNMEKTTNEFVDTQCNVINGKETTEKPSNTFIPHSPNRKEHTKPLHNHIASIPNRPRLNTRDSRDMEKIAAGWYLGRHNALGIHLPLYRTDIFYRRQQKNHSSLKACMLGTSCPELVDTSGPQENHGKIYRKCASFFEDGSDILRSMVDIRIFCNPFFAIFAASNFIFYFWSDVPYMYAADNAMDVGVEPYKASLLLSIIGILNTVGQVVFGCFGDLKFNLLNMYGGITVFAGVVVAIVPLMSVYWSMCVTYAAFGFFVSVSFPLTTILLVKYLGVEKLTNAYGLLMLMQGIANIFGPPFAGWISDRTEGYSMAFYLSGMFFSISGLILFLVYIPGLKVAPKIERTTLAASTDDIQV